MKNHARERVDGVEHSAMFNPVINAELDKQKE